VSVGDRANWKIGYINYFGTVAWVGVDDDGTVKAGLQIEDSHGGPIEVLASQLTRVVLVDA
jgi:hypothetical protein